MKWLDRNKEHLLYEFLPSAEEIIESPAVPFGKVVIYLVTLLLIVSLAWSYLGQIDIIVSAPGKISTEGSTKIIQPAVSGVVKNIHVHEGQVVRQGDMLVQLDTQSSENDVATLEKSLAMAKLERDILAKLAVGASADDAINTAHLPDDLKDNLRQFARSRAANTQSQQNLLQQSITSTQQQFTFSQQSQQNATSTLQKLKQQEQGINEKLKNANVFERSSLRSELVSLQQRISTAESSLISQNQQVANSRSAISEAQQKLQSVRTDQQANAYNTIVAQNKRIVELENNLAKAKQLQEQATIKAPVSGTILSLVTKTIGGVVNAGERIAQIVPEKAPLYVDATLQNQDVGFVKIGQRVVVKVATYPFQRYGYLEGTIETVSPDAVSDEQQGLIYRTKVKLSNSKSSKQNSLKLLPGMSVSAEITTGKRRIIEFFLDPLITHTEDSLKVR